MMITVFLFGFVANVAQTASILGVLHDLR